MVTDFTRRRLLKAALFGSTLPLLPVGCALNPAKQSQREALIGCSFSGIDDYRVVVATQQGEKIRDLPLPTRGHGVAIHPQLPHAVAVARRPGQFMSVFDYLRGEQIKLTLAESSRYFYGHGVYGLDGRYLYVTEGERQTSRGIIGVYSVEQGYVKVAELTGFGIGPHEIIVKSDGTLVIGVGGVHTDGRKPLNLDQMQPWLTYMTAQGEILEQVSLPDHHLSIRHLAHDGDDTILCGQQYRGEPDNYPSLIAMHKPGQQLLPLQAEPEQWARFNHYIASIAATDKWILATSPPGNCYGIWSKQSRELVELRTLPDASGVVAHQGAFYISSGAGKVVQAAPPSGSIIKSSTIQWDNHWSAIPLTCQNC